MQNHLFLWNIQFYINLITLLFYINNVQAQKKWDIVMRGKDLKINLHGIYFENESIGYISFYKYIDSTHGFLRTTDGGKRWDTVYQKTPPVDMYHFQFINRKYGFSGSYTSDDSGATWTSYAANIPLKYIGTTISYPVESFYFIDSMTGWIGSNAIGILKTTDRCQTWEIQSYNSEVQSDIYNVSDLYFIDSLTGWAVGGDRFFLHATTIDGGSMWKNIHYHNEPPYAQKGTVNALSFPDRNHGYACEKEGGFYKTLDGGITWQSVPTPVPVNFNTAYFNDVVFIDSLHGWFVGTGEHPDSSKFYGLIAETSDGCKTWELTYLPTTPQLDFIIAPSSHSIFTLGIFGSGGILYQHSNLSNVHKYQQNRISVSSPIPNPTTGFIVLPITIIDSHNTINEAKISITNLSGTIIESINKPINPGVNNLHLDFSLYNSGLYYLYIQIGNQNFTTTLTMNQ
ncbi:MAG: T9SS type A sorting domain-containing protein [Chlorobi bacterium]|nr:T9SS type A sorting domain-containing protein [Chlorobiota bacterium]